MDRDKLPEGANILPSIWAFAIKRDPAGEIKKHKARFCVRGDKQIEGVDYVDSYAPVVSWSTVRIMLSLAIKQGWAPRQVDFSNAFVQATLDEEVYVSLPAMFQDETGKESKLQVLKLIKSLYGLVQAPRSWFYHLADGFKKLGFKSSKVEPGVFFGQGMVVISWLDDCLFFGPDKSKIDKIRSWNHGIPGYTRRH